METVDTLIFDMDGVLVDVSESYDAAIKKTVESMLDRSVPESDFRRSLRQIRSKGGVNNDWDLCIEYLKREGTLSKRKEVVARFQNFMTSGLNEKEKWIADMKRISALKRNYQLAIVTGRPRIEAVETLNRNNRAQFFDMIVCMEDVEKQKPDPEGLLKVKACLNVAGAIYFGDTVDDMRAAKKAGIIPVGICNDNTGEYTALLKEAGAYHIVADINLITEEISWIENR